MGLKRREILLLEEIRMLKTRLNRLSKILKTLLHPYLLRLSKMIDERLNLLSMNAPTSSYLK